MNLQTFVNHVLNDIRLGIDMANENSHGWNIWYPAKVDFEIFVNNENEVTFSRDYGHKLVFTAVFIDPDDLNESEEGQTHE